MANTNTNNSSLLSALLGSLAPKTAQFYVGDAVWFWGTPFKNNPDKLKRCDIHSDVKFIGKIVSVNPNGFYSVMNLKTGVVFQRPFVDTDLYPMNDQEKTHKAERFVTAFNPEVN